MFLKRICKWEKINLLNCIINLRLFAWCHGATNLVLKLIRFNAPILRDEASVNSFECSSITRQIRYKRRNIGSERATSSDTIFVSSSLFLLANFVVHEK